MSDPVRPHRRQPTRLLLSLGFSRQEHWSGLPFPSPMHACMLSRFSRVRLCATPWTATHQAPLSTGFSRQEYWSGLPFPSSRDWMRDGLKFWSICHLYYFLKCQQMSYFFLNESSYANVFKMVISLFKKIFHLRWLFQISFLHFSSEEIHT